GVRRSLPPEQVSLSPRAPPLPVWLIAAIPLLSLAGQERFHPRVGHHSGAGYKSNYRPVVFYKASLDQVDNPAVGHLLQDNYDTVTTKHFRPLQLPDGKYPLPWSVYQPGSGFVRDKPISFPTTKAVKKVHFDTRDQGPRAITGLEPRQLPVLHKPQGKGSVEGENARHGPLYMSTEYNSKFRFDIPGQPDFLQRKTIGAKEETGFTEGTQWNPITILPSPPGEPVGAGPWRASPEVISALD
uniref:Stabilizer of axonemal microtubules 4 n=1 Tax=Gopherus evgoodei TaxID=1825980 RepID=A0A8C4VW73_9SAUR